MTIQSGYDHSLFHPLKVNIHELVAIVGITNRPTPPHRFHNLNLPLLLVEIHLGIGIL